MTSLANTKRMKKLFKALLLVGVFLVLVMPVFVHGADKATVANSEPVKQSVVTTTDQIVDLVVDQPVLPVENNVTDTITSTSTVVDDISSSTETSSVATSSEDIQTQISASTTEEIVISSTTIATVSLLPIVGEIISTKAASEPTISDEINGVSGSTTDDTTDNKDYVISDEVSGTSTGTESTSTTEGDFTTSDGTSGNTPVISDEVSFTTSDNGGGDDDEEVVSDELSFTTGEFTGVISDEYSFNTSSGGGGGGGSIVPVITTFVCKPYLLEFIKFGANNNPYEVRKLQAFLIVFEKENRLKVTGYYDQTTYEAVERFQKKYSRDVLGPWGIDDSTGYVFITTKLAINNVYCNRSTANDLDLRNYYGQIEDLIKPATTTIATSTEISSTSLSGLLIDTTTPKGIKLLQVAFVGLLDFLRDIPCWLWNLILLLLIILLLLVIWYMSEEEEEYLDGLDDGDTNQHQEIITSTSDTIEAEKEYKKIIKGE